VRTVGDEAFEPFFQFRRGIGFYNTDRIEPASACLFVKCGSDCGVAVQKSRSA
jgi:hypothetical protein